jgi:tetratricopeptide (TPR) repeat protein
MTSSAELDAQELLHLGLHAAQNDEPQRAIECLKRSLDLDPTSAKATYLLGAIYAQIGLYDRAKLLMSRALELDPSEHTAYFQLGLLHLTSGAVDEARAAWSGLDSLPQDHFLNCFRAGLLALTQDDFAECIAQLESGIAGNRLNEALNADMRKVQASARTAMGHQPAKTADESQTTATNRGHHLLESYRQQNR